MLIFALRIVFYLTFHVDPVGSAFIQRNKMKVKAELTPKAFENIFFFLDTGWNQICNFIDLDTVICKGMNGVVKFLEDLSLDPASRIVLIIAWKFKENK